MTRTRLAKPSPHRARRRSSTSAPDRLPDRSLSLESTPTLGTAVTHEATTPSDTSRVGRTAPSAPAPKPVAPTSVFLASVTAP